MPAGLNMKDDRAIEELRAWHVEHVHGHLPELAQGTGNTTRRNKELQRKKTRHLKQSNRLTNLHLGKGGLGGFLRLYGDKTQKKVGKRQHCDLKIPMLQPSNW